MSELTVYATINDGSVYAGATSYTTAHDASSGTTRPASEDTFHIQNTKYIDNNYYIDRAFLYFDTSGLPDGATITDAVLGLYCSSYAEPDEGYATIHIVEGVQDDPYNNGDYSDHLNKTTSGGSHSYPPVSGEYTEIVLNATGRGWINKTGTTKFCLRLSGDINASAPTAQNQVTVYAADKGTGYKPKLVITYAEGEVKNSSDNGGGLESIALRELDIAEAGSGVEQSQTSAVVFTGDAGIGSEIGGLLKGLFGQDEGSGLDSIKVLISKAGYDLRLRSHQGQVGILHKEVRL